MNQNTVVEEKFNELIKVITGWKFPEAHTKDGMKPILSDIIHALSEYKLSVVFQQNERVLFYIEEFELGSIDAFECIKCIKKESQIWDITKD